MEIEMTENKRIWVVIPAYEPDEKLLGLLKDLKEELFQLRFQLAINQLDNPMRISAVKKDIARVKTILRQRELEETNA